ncbi:relaxase/mobilization nuclease domain-containing protein [Kitasatospora sp. NPDC056138]|uniref:relaxase/mobilization nuclease domain-containing protein n=1 Tax=Kitasatospora sp. NPDC056138 TaxID=3345724 RepID=UPI0035DCDE43
MVPKIRRGSNTRGLLAYLYGPGKRDEHTDPHLVGSWDGFAPDPGRDPEATLSRLAASLDLRVKQAGTQAPAEHVWHCSVRTDPGDRLLADTEWDTIARHLIQAVNLAPNGDPDGCRWVAVRHADDHIHILATMVRGDLRRARLNYDLKKAQAECRRIEKEMGLRQLTPGDGTAAKKPTSAERFKAERTGRTETPRETLHTTVRQALAGAATEAEFFTRVREAGLRVKLRHAPSGDVLGYTVALPGDRNRNAAPIWFAGSTLAPDLSLPKIRQRLADATVTTEPNAPGTPGRWSPPANARRHATQTAEHAVTRLATDDDEGAAQLIGVGELLDATARTSPAATRSELVAAARAFERATRSRVRAERADTRALRSAARGIIQAGGALGRGEDGGATAMLLSTLVLVTLAAARWHSARGHAQQAAASRQAAEHLRAAYQQAAATPMHTMCEAGRAIPAAERRHYDTTIRTVLGDDQPPSAPARDHDALAAVLAEAEKAGHDPTALLEEVTSWRGLGIARSRDDVLVWRIRRIANLPADPAPPRSASVTSTRTTAKLGRTAPRVAQSAPAQPATDRRRPTPRR